MNGVSLLERAEAAERELTQVRVTLAFANRVRRIAEAEAHLLRDVAEAARHHLEGTDPFSAAHLTHALNRWEAGRDGGF